MRLEEIQAALRTEGLDGWLFFDHHRRDPLAYRVLQFTPGSMVTRRWFYFVPAQGEPRVLVSVTSRALASRCDASLASSLAEDLPRTNVRPRVGARGPEPDRSRASMAAWSTLGLA